MTNILVIDPALMESPGRGFVWLEQLRHETFGEAVKFERFAPQSDSRRLRDIFDGSKYDGMIVLGSAANVTDGLPWVNNLAEDLACCLLNQPLPCLGICFGHQVIAHALGALVDYVIKKNERTQKFQRCYRGIRIVSILHPKLALLNARIGKMDYFSQNKADLDFCFALKYSWNFRASDWEYFLLEPYGDNIVHSFSKDEQRFRNFLYNNVDWGFWARVQHEQEIVSLENTPLVHAATSLLCQYDGCVHPFLPIYTLQSHPETKIPVYDSWRILRNFLYVCVNWKSRI